MKKHRILVTGGSGFLGAALVRKLVYKGHDVRVLDNGFRTSTQNLNDCDEHIEKILGDIRNSDITSQAIAGRDMVIHLAAINGTQNFYTHPQLVLDVGVRGILNVIEGCIKHGVTDLLVASSSEVYQTPAIIPTDETEKLVVPDVLNPRYSYGGSKIITELLTIHNGHKFQRAVIFRPHNVYGPAMGKEHVLPQFILRALELIQKHPQGPLPFPIQGDGTQTRAFLHIEDMVEGILVLLEKGEHLHIYHIGNQVETSIAELAKKVVSYFGKEILLKKALLQQGSTERRCPDIKKMTALGFAPKVSLDQGLPSMVEWYANEFNSSLNSYL